MLKTFAFDLKAALKPFSKMLFMSNFELHSFECFALLPRKNSFKLGTQIFARNLKLIRTFIFSLKAASKQIFKMLATENFEFKRF